MIHKVGSNDGKTLEAIINLCDVSMIEKIGSTKNSFKYKVVFKSGAVTETVTTMLLNDFNDYLDSLEPKTIRIKKPQ